MDFSLPQVNRRAGFSLDTSLQFQALFSSPMAGHEKLESVVLPFSGSHGDLQHHRVYFCMYKCIYHSNTAQFNQFGLHPKNRRQTGKRSNTALFF